MVFPSLLMYMLGFSLSKAHLIRRDDGPPSPGDSTVPDPGVITPPSTAKAPNTFSNGKDRVTTEYPYSTDPIPDVYQPRAIDVPFGRMMHGNMTYFPQGQLNDPNSNTDQWTPNQYDFPEQSACGIPDNAYWQGKVAIHPYWLKYAGLDRYCMSDVCVSIWSEFEGIWQQGDNPDMLVKVTDICSTDPADPTYCATPYDIKLDRAKVQILYQINDSSDPRLQGSKFPQGGYWHLAKCWTNALPQPAYYDNWFSQPVLPNNFHWAIDSQKSQMLNNQQSYAAKNWTLYPDGNEIPTPDSKAAMVPIDDWVPGEEPSWTPIAGGKGYGTPKRSQGPPASPNGAAAQGNNAPDDGEDWCTAEDMAVQ